MTFALLWACVGPDPGGGAAGGATGADADTAATGETDTEADSDTSAPIDTGTAPVTDADGDGHDALDHGGDDCNDANAAVHPDATEYCDAVDQDCDGEPMPAGMCGETTPAAAAATPLLSFDYSHAVVGTVRDITGDGVDDLQLIRIQAYNDIFVYAGGPLTGAPIAPDPANAWHYVEEEAYDYFQQVREGGDVNGDGYNDLLVSETNGGGIAVHFGPIHGPGGRLRMLSDSDGYWPSYMQGDFWDVAISGYDFDGDGRNDVLAGNDTLSAWEPYVSDIVYELYFGGEWEPRCPVRIDNDGLYQTSGGQGGAVGDGDGDGLADFAYAAMVANEDPARAGNWFISGADSRLLCDAATDEVAVARLANGWVHQPIGDWSGDGVEEWVLIEGGADPGEDAVFIMSAAAPFTGMISSDDALGSFLLPESGVRQLRYVHTPDFDGDGTQDLVLQEDSGGLTHVLRGGEIPAPHSPLPDRRLVFDDETSGSVCGWYACNGDFDGDGFDDLVAGRFTDFGEPFHVGIIQGFDVPWEDDSAW